MNKKNIRPIAIYLPQFHPIPENDEWWGKGFTEWRNVVKAKPQFKNHYQPHLPADLGFYDLRLEESRMAQEEMAKAYGIHGFCYYHYWFNGRRILEKPLDKKLNNPKEDLPFMLCWANENWTRAWDGGESKVLLKQNYNREDDIKHINSLIPYFKDERYIKVQGKPVFIIYKDFAFPDIRSTLSTFRNEASKQGMELYLCRFDRTITLPESPNELGFDAAFEFQPLTRAYLLYKKNKFLNIKSYLNYAKRFGLNIQFSQNNRFDYRKIIDIDLALPQKKYKCYPGVSPGWDNSSRRPIGRAFIFENSTPELFLYWLIRKLQDFKPYSDDENFLMINAWNEWAEGNHMEPCEKWGFQYLEALKKGLSE